jgi:hypothetical protein
MKLRTKIGLVAGVTCLVLKGWMFALPLLWVVTKVSPLLAVSLFSALLGAGVLD